MFCCLFFGNFCCGQPTAAALRSRHHSSAASAWGERRAIQRMQGIRAHPQLAHDHGNIFSGREAAHSATTERSLRINACTGLHCGATPPPIATAKGQPAVEAPQWVLADPTKEKEQLRNSSLSDRSRENSRRPQGMRRTPPVSAHVCRCNLGARAALTRSTGLTSRANGLKAARVCAARAASVFTALAPALCAHQAGALPRKLRRSSHSTAVTARNLQLHSHAQRAGSSTFNASPNRASDYSPLCPRSIRR